MGALQAGNTWITSTLIDAAVDRSIVAVDDIRNRQNIIVSEYIRMNNELAKVKADLRVENVLRVCAQRPEVCEDK